MTKRGRHGNTPAMLDVPETHRDLLDAQVATLATVDDDGFPQLTEVWFLHDDGELRISLNSGRRKTHNLERRPQCSVLLLDLQNPYRYLEIRGRARLEPTTARSRRRSARSTGPTCRRTTS